MDWPKPKTKGRSSSHDTHVEILEQRHLKSFGQQSRCFNPASLRFNGEDITPRYLLFLNVPSKLWGQPDIWQPLLGEAVRPSWLLQGVAGRNQVLCVEVDGTERHETWTVSHQEKKKWILEGTGAGTRWEMDGTKGCRRRIRTFYWRDICQRNSLMPLVCQSPEFPEAFKPRLKVDGSWCPMYIL